MQFILYYMKALASRPDDGGSYREFADQLDLSTSVQCFNRPLLEEDCFRFDEAVLNIERDLKIDDLYERHQRKRQRLDDGEGKNVDEQDPRSAPK